MTSLEDEPGTPPARRAGRHMARRLFTLAVTALAVWFLLKTLREVGLGALNARLLGADPLIVAIVILLTILRFLSIALRWEILARREAPVGLRRIAPVLMAGHFLSLVTPVVRIAGPILRAYYLSRETGRPRARFYGTIVADQTANFTVFAAAVSISGVLVTTPVLQITPALGASMLVALFGGLLLGYLMLRDVHRGAAPRLTRFLKATIGTGSPGSWRDRMIGWWDELIHALSASVIGSGAWWPSLLLSTVSFGLVAAVQILAFAAVGRPIGVMEGVFAVAGAGFIQILSAAPGGPGLTEASLIVVALALGIDKEPAVAGVFLARFANYIVLLPWGGHSFFRLQRKYGMPEASAGATTA